MAKNVLEAGIETGVGSELQKQTPVKESWFRGYLEGNGKWPQHDTPGINILTTAAVLQDPPKRWQEFFQTELSGEQVKRLISGMVGYHRRAGIKVADKDHAEKGDKIVSSHFFERSWITHGRRMVGKWLSRFIQKDTDEPWKILNPEEIDAYFIDPENSEAIEELRTVTQLAADALMSPEGIVLSEEHKAAMRGSSNLKFTMFYIERDKAANRLIKSKLEAKGFSEKRVAWMDK